ncbi:MAG: cobalt-zinc-cadmium efflux system membrane fusion protein [Planctomycetota bacterium]|jgi:cobalt-zinc-cadmium efflux system membrane fusion protein
MSTRSNYPCWLWIVLIALFCACSPQEHLEDEHAGHDDHGEEEGHVELTKKQFDAAGLKVVTAAPGKVADALTLAGSVAPNADSVLHVTPRVPGQVRSVYKQLGESVQKGELLCIIDSVELGDAVADYLRHEAMLKAAQSTIKREGELFDERRTALSEVLDGAIQVQERIHAREKELQEKAVTTVRPLLEAERALQLAKLDKSKKHNELKAERDTRILELELILQAETIDYTAANNRLRALGLDSKDLQEISVESPLLAGEYRVYSSGTGIVVRRHVTTGEFVAAGSQLYVIEDLSDVWFVASAFEEQLQSLYTGQKALVSLDAFQEIPLSGLISFIDYHVDPVTRTVGVRIELNNQVLESWPEELPLRPGMFGSVELYSDSRDARIVIPESALVHEDGGDSVFVQVEPLGFELRDVKVKHASGGLVEVLSGLEAGERVVVTGTFMLKSAERQADLGGGHNH